MNLVPCSSRDSLGCRWPKRVKQWSHQGCLVCQGLDWHQYCSTSRGIDYFLISKVISAEVVLISLPFLHSTSTGHPSSLGYFQTLGHQTFQTSLKGWLLKNTASVNWFCVIQTSMFIERVFPKRSWDFLPLFFIFERLSKSFGTGRQLYIWRLKPIICVS